MQTRTLGTHGPRISAIGLGCMGMSALYGPADDKQSIAVIHRALDVGVNFLDTADMYGLGKNEELVGKALKGRRDEAILETRFHIVCIPGTRNIERLEQNAAAAAIVLTPEDRDALDAIAPRDVAAGLRYPEATMRAVNG